MTAPECIHGHGPKSKTTDRSNVKGWRWQCLTCNRMRAHMWFEANTERHRETGRAQRVAYPSLHRERSRRSVERNRAIVAAELEARGGGCVHPGCTETTIEWHHRDPATKVAAIATLMSKHARTARLRAELAKCDPLCAAHHREAHRRLLSAVRAVCCGAHTESPRAAVTAGGMAEGGEAPHAGSH